MTTVYSETFLIHFKRTETMKVDKHLSQEIKSSVLFVILNHRTPLLTNKIEISNVKQVHITLVKYRGYCMTTRGIRICDQATDSISHEELSKDGILFFQTAG